MNMANESTDAPRRYDNSRRAAAARATRARIVTAAAECFTEQGFDATTVRSIAERAATSPETVYAAFGTKAAVLQAWIDRAVAGDDHDGPLLTRPDIADLAAAPDPISTLRAFARIGREINARVAVPFEVLRSAAAAIPELAALAAENERRRHADLATFVDHLAARGAIRNGLPRARTIELVAALASVDLYRALVLDAGWSATGYEEQVTRLLAAAIDAPEAPHRRGGG